MMASPLKNFRLRHQRPSTSGGRVHNVEMQQETATALANIATSATSDWKAFITLTATNANLARQITTLTSHLVTAQSKITTLTAHLSAKGGGNGEGNSNSNPCTGNFPGLDPMGYCWSDWWRVRKGHLSSTCSNQKIGHDTTARQANTKGWTGE